MAKIRSFLLIGGLALHGVLAGCDRAEEPHGETIPGVREYPTSAQAPSTPGTTAKPPVSTSHTPPAVRTGGVLPPVAPARTDQRTGQHAPAPESAPEPAREPAPAAPTREVPSSAQEQEFTSTPDAPTNTNSAPETTTPTGDIPGGPYTPE
ncbi:hypothetical protein GCM10010185_01470 [Saccharothrix coeruleofusca]|uniref:Uncharacterized protein n=1 Tax=Saccharothrix coeruleofusca TaxID=33919 RepID=A0A918AJE7_9PSEU|nr:hypothetical protein GCM10010185_01470 [Saccharothrix coeruleofusca]